MVIRLHDAIDRRKRFTAYATAVRSIDHVSKCPAMELVATLFFPYYPADLKRWKVENLTHYEDPPFAYSVNHYETPGIIKHSGILNSAQIRVKTTHLQFLKIKLTQTSIIVMLKSMKKTKPLASELPDASVLPTNNEFSLAKNGPTRTHLANSDDDSKPSAHTQATNQTLKVIYEWCCSDICKTVTNFFIKEGQIALWDSTRALSALGGDHYLSVTILVSVMSKLHLELSQSG
uniref:Uncharacterized protein n=1 Tax=Romanomermis culicivorax TaxID=13658 RepID=A0A915K031_ROMCU